VLPGACPSQRLQHRAPRFPLVFSYGNTASRTYPARGRRKLPPPPGNAHKREVEDPALAANPRLFPLSPYVPCPACHAGGRGFESRLSRKDPCKAASFVAYLGAIDRRPL